jgi:CTP-dependent riboflavin kinase
MKTKTQSSKLIKGRVLTQAKHPWINNPEYSEKLAWMEENGLIEKVARRKSNRNTSIVITDTGVQFLRNQVPELVD